MSYGVICLIKDIKKDRTLLLLTIMEIFNFFVMLFGGMALYFKYIFLVFTFLIIIFSKKESFLPIILFVHCNSALYDDIGFTYFFNFTLFIICIKILFLKSFSFSKSSFLLFVILLLYEIILRIIFNTISFDRKFFSLVSWSSSYLIMIYYSCLKEINFNKIYRYFFVGMVGSCLCAITIPINRWGINNIPTAYRFVGLLRDPNYFSIDILFLIFSLKLYTAKSEKLFYKMILIVFGFLSVSKMYILILSFGLFLDFIISKKKINKNKLFFVFISILCLIAFISYSNIISLIFDKYLYRFDSNALTTGRDYIQNYYINKLLNSPTTLLFGRTMQYNEIFHVGSDNGYSFYYQMVAHNTYLDFLLSWGLLGTYVYIKYLLSINNNFKNNGFVSNKRNYYLTIVVVFVFCLFALSYLALDAFAILLLYLFICKYYNSSGEEMYEK